MPDDFCPECGEWGCVGCEYDDPDPGRCTFCGEYECDGSGYNCPDGHYQDYNLRGFADDEGASRAAPG